MASLEENELRIDFVSVKYFTIVKIAYWISWTYTQNLLESLTASAHYTRPLLLIAEHHQQIHIIVVHPWLSLFIADPRRLSLIITSCRRLSPIIAYYRWSSPVIANDLLLSLIITGYRWSSLAITQHLSAALQTPTRVNPFIALFL